MDNATVTNLTVSSRHNCYQISPESMQAIQETGVSIPLEIGSNIVKLRHDLMPDEMKRDAKLEPVVLLWIYGGKVINQKTNVPVAATWASLNGYDDALVLNVLEPAMLCALFFDTRSKDEEQDLLLSVIRV